MTHTRILTLIATGLLAGGLLVGCGDSNDVGAPDTTPTSTAVVTTPPGIPTVPDTTTPAMPDTTTPAVPDLSVTVPDTAPSASAPVTADSLPADSAAAEWATVMLDAGMQVISTDTADIPGASLMLSAQGETVTAQLVIYGSEGDADQAKALYTDTDRSATLTKGAAFTTLAGDTSAADAAAFTTLRDALTAKDWN